MPYVDGVDRPTVVARRPALLVVRYSTSADASPTDPGYSVGVPLDASERPAGPFATGGPPPMPGLGAFDLPRATTEPDTGAVAPRPLSAADFDAGSAARRSPTFIAAGKDGGVARGGMEQDDPWSTWINYFALDGSGTRTEMRWVRLPRHVERPGGPNAWQVVEAVVLTPVTLTADVLSIPLGILYPFLGGS